MTDPSFESATSDPDRLLAGEKPRTTKDVTIVSGQNVVAGTVLGERTASTVPATATADAGNTGNGTMGSVAGGLETMAGIYTIECVEVVANGGIFAVVDPDGNRVGSDAVVAVAYVSPHLNFTIADGATDFALGDKFTVTVSGSGEFLAAAAAAADGSNRPKYIAADAIDATLGAKEGPVYMEGEFNESALTFGVGHSAATVRADLEARGIILRTTVAR